MFNLDTIKNVYLLGIGGIGMSALARFFKSRGCQVSGYDKTATSLTQTLEKEGIVVYYSDEVQLLPEFIRNGFNTQTDLIIYTPAIPPTHASYIYLRENNFILFKRSQVLGKISEGYYTIAVAGTHGKTTTSSMIAHIAVEAGFQTTGFLGGITKNFNGNLVLPDPKAKGKSILVVEADEFDRSFLTLNPDIIVITSLDADHLDIYGNHDEMISSYQLFTQQLKPEGIIITKPEVIEKLQIKNGRSYSLDGNADYRAKRVQVLDGKYQFDIHFDQSVLEDVRCGLPGRHNVENAVAASAVCDCIGVSFQKIKDALASFKGIKRRFEVFYSSKNLIGIDDYAHHPTEIRAALTSVRELYPDKRIYTVFQPHLYSRTRDFMEEFSEVLALSDVLYLLEIYPARELPIKGITSSALFEKIPMPMKYLVSKEAFLQKAQQIQEGVVLVLGAGDIDQIVTPLAELYSKRND
ncbi:MAG TPA: UDP-N-acetylmuramate--L-alanine ligase [Bacteroidia bacterium]|nr:UDP-N-acetylmuramate--L-alanine ligase [Bacteroidia bacterium]HNT79884.1 UDP-N-acetylmuramate--L-alanine ligase [Bacteroidia bacterium]